MVTLGLQRSLPGAPSSVSASLAPGASGPGVEELQALLNLLGMDVPITGSYDQATIDAVRAVQARLGLRADGVVDPATKRALSPGFAQNDTFELGGSGQRAPSFEDLVNAVPALAQMGVSPEAAAALAEQLRRGRSSSVRPRAGHRVRFGPGPSGASLAGSAPTPVGPHSGQEGKATFERVLTRGRGQLVEGKITVNGNQYRFRSGGGGNGNLPPGTYRVTPHLNSRSDYSMSVDGVGYSFAMSDKFDPRVGQSRGLLRIHPDGGGPGTVGCIGIVGNGATQAQFRRDMNAAIRRAGGAYTLTVGGA